MSNLNTSKYPKVSIVIPVYNEGRRLKEVLTSLKRQEYPADLYEIIVVDNGSSDRSPQVAREIEGVRLLFEVEKLGSPYSARNRGIEASDGNIVALLDSKCVPVKNWILSSIRTMRERRADMVGGNVSFKYKENVTPGKIYDAINNLKMEEYVKERGVAPTCNLFVHRKVFRDIGLFPEGIRSGGDLRWTGNATRKGWKLVYSPEATVYYPARSLGPLLQKQFRVAKGQPEIWRKSGTKSVVIRILKHLLKPISLKEVKEKIDRRGEDFMYDYLWQVWFVHYIVKLMMSMGRLYGMINTSSGASNS